MDCCGPDVPLAVPIVDLTRGTCVKCDKAYKENEDGIWRLQEARLAGAGERSGEFVAAD